MAKQIMELQKVADKIYSLSVKFEDLSDTISHLSKSGEIATNRILNADKMFQSALQSISDRVMIDKTIPSHLKQAISDEVMSYKVKITTGLNINGL